METDSQNKPKAKRGRPKSGVRLHAEELDKMGLTSDAESSRAKIDQAYAQAFFSAWAASDQDTQRQIMGYTADDSMKGKATHQRGYATAAAEIGRWIVGEGVAYETMDDALHIVLTMRQDGRAWRDIRLHFRRLRLGTKEGNAQSLRTHITRAIDDYCRKFPATSEATKIQAVLELLASMGTPGE